MRIVAFAVCSFVLGGALAQKIPRQPYVRHETEDRLGRTIRYFLSERAREEPTDLPLIVYIQGSGSASHFTQTADGTIRGATGHSSLADIVRSKARLMLVDKPGTIYLADDRTPGGSELFRREHTLGQWSEAIRAAIEAYVKTTPTERILVAGHSEGGLVAARVANLDARTTHVALLAGGGPSQLFDLVTLARRGDFFKSVSDNPEARVQFVLDQWRAILAEPNSTEKLFMGHAYTRWSSFLSASPIQELQGVKAKILVAQGGEDKAVDPASADALVTQLLSLGKAPAYLRVEHADHSFKRSDKPGDFDGWSSIWKEILGWFLT